MKKKYVLYGLLLILMFVVLTPSVYAAEELHFCNQDSLKAFIFIGHIINVIKIVIPLIIIILGMVDFARAMISNDDKATMSAAKSLVLRLIAGVIVFLIPTIFYGILNLVFPDEINDYDNMACTKCILRVSECDYDTMSGSLPEK